MESNTTTNPDPNQINSATGEPEVGEYKPMTEGQKEELREHYRNLMQSHGDEAMQSLKKMSKDESKVEFRSLVMQVSCLEDELLVLNQRWDNMDKLDWDDPKFNEAEYNRLEEEIEEKHNVLMDLRSKS